MNKAGTTTATISKPLINTAHISSDRFEKNDFLLVPSPVYPGQHWLASFSSFYSTIII
ncbi:MAG: hypothetical protein WDO16_14330 [Bacteroidota bacterium]